MALFKKKARFAKERQRILSEQIDFTNIITSAFHAKQLYDQLKVKYHPDRFLDVVKKEQATKLFQQITENKENYEVLMQLKEQAETLFLNQD